MKIKSNNYKQDKMKIIVTLIFLINISNVVCGQKVNAFIDDYFNQTLSSNVGGYSYVIFKENDIVAQGGNGIAVPNAHQPKSMTSETRMQIASCSKAITAIALLKELENHTVNVETTLGKILAHEFPKMSELTKAITLKNLLTHKSGYNFGYLETPHKIGLEKLFSENPPNAIDSNMSYSNLNYAILRYVIEFISKTDYEEYVKTNILDKVPNNNFSLSSKVGDSHAYNFPVL